MTKNQIVSRSVDFTPTPEAAQDGDGRTMCGYGAVFGAATRINNHEGDFQESIAPGAFRKTLQERMPIVQYNHGRDVRVGTTPIASLEKINEDAQGLYVEARMFDNPVVEPIRQAIAAGAIPGMSFNFRVLRDEWRDGRGIALRPEELGRLLYGAGDRGPLQRTLKEVQLYEVGPVSSPAYSQTSVGVRSSDAADLSEHDRAALVAEYLRTAFTPQELAAYVADPGSTPAPVPGPGGPPTPGPLPGDKGVRDAGPATPAGPAGPATPSPLPGDKLVPEEIAREINEMLTVHRAAEPPSIVRTYADPGYLPDKRKRFPLDSAEAVTAAWDSIHGKAGNKYKSHQRRVIKDAINAAAARFDVKLKLPTESNSASDVDAALRGTSANGNRDDAAHQGTSSGHDTNNQGKAVPMPKSIDELRSRLAEIDARMAELGADVTRSFDETEQTEFDALHAEGLRTEADIEKIEERAATMAKIAARVPGSTERGSDKGPAFHREAEDIYDTNKLRTESRSVEDYTRKLRDNAFRAIEKADFGGDVDIAAAQTQVERLVRKADNKRGELAERILATGTEAYERAWGKMVMSGGAAFLTGEERQAIERAQLAGTDSAGGFAVPFQLDPTVMLDNNSTNNPIRDLARQVQIVGKQWNGVVTTGVTVTRGAEASTAPDNTFSLTQPTLTTNRVQGFVPFSIEIDLEWNQLRSEIAALLLDAKAREEDSFITGDGTGTNPFGVVGTLTGQAVAPASALTFAAADIYNMETALAPRWRKQGQFLANKAIYNRVRQFDSAGGAQLWQRIGAGLPPELLGYPVHEASAMISTGSGSSGAFATGDKPLLFGDFSNFLIVDRIGMSVELVPQVFDAANSNRPTGQRGIYAIWMNNSKILVKDAFKLLTM